METLYKALLVMHVISGLTSLITGLIAIVSKKGKRIHRTTGITYFYSMLIVCLSAISISLLKNNIFLLHVGIFSFAMVYNGYKSIKNKSLYPDILDWIVLIIGLVNSIIMISSLKIILIVFGIIGASLCYSDIKIFISIIMKKELPKNQWLLRHLGMMLGGYISTLSAFIVVNIQYTEYPLIPWLAPTIIGTPLIAYWTSKYKIKNN